MKQALAAYRVFGENDAEVPGESEEGGPMALEQSDHHSAQHPFLHDMGSKATARGAVRVPVVLQRKYSQVVQKERRRQAQTLRFNLITPPRAARGGTDAASPVDAFGRHRGAERPAGRAPDLGGTSSSGATLAAELGTSLSLSPWLGHTCHLHFQLRDVREPPPAANRVNHTVTEYEGALYMFGGRAASARQGGGGSDHYASTAVSVFVPTRSAWIEVPARGQPPCRRGDHSAVVHRDRLIIFGGRKQLLVFDDMAAFDFTDGTWRPIPFEVGCGPGAIFGHATAVYNERMYVIGGVHRTETTHLLHCFDLKYHYWLKIDGPPEINPNGLFQCAVAVHPSRAELFVLGLVPGDVPVADVTLEEALLGNVRRRSADFLEADAGRGASAIFGQREHEPLSLLGAGASSAGTNRYFNSSNDRSASPPGPDAPLAIHVLDLTTQIWRVVRSTVAPDSPIPFTPALIRECLMPQLVAAGGGALQSGRGQWHFLIQLPPMDAASAELAGALVRRGDGGGGTPSASTLATPREQPMQLASAAVLAVEKRSAPSLTAPKAAPRPAPERTMAVLSFHFATARWSLALAARGATTDRAIARWSLAGTAPFERRYAVAWSTTGTTEHLVVCGGGTAETHLHTRAVPNGRPHPTTASLNYAMHGFPPASARTPSLGMTPQQPSLEAFSLSHSRGERAGGGSGQKSRTSSLGGPLGPRKATTSSSTQLRVPHRPSRRSSLADPASPLLPVHSPEASSGAGATLRDDTGGSQVPFFVPHHPETGAGHTLLASPGCPVARLAGGEIREWEAQLYRAQRTWIVTERREMERMTAAARRRLKKGARGGRTGKGAGTAALGTPQQEKFFRCREASAEEGSKEATRRNREARLDALRMGCLLFDAPMLEFSRDELYNDPRLLVLLRWGLLRQYVLSGRAAADAASSSSSSSSSRRPGSEWGPRGGRAPRSVGVPVGLSGQLALLPMVTATHAGNGGVASAAQEQSQQSQPRSAPQSAPVAELVRAKRSAARDKEAAATKKWGLLVSTLAPLTARASRAVPVHPVPYET